MRKIAKYSVFVVAFIFGAGAVLIAPLFKEVRINSAQSEALTPLRHSNEKDSLSSHPGIGIVVGDETVRALGDKKLPIQDRLEMVLNSARLNANQPEIEPIVATLRDSSEDDTLRNETANLLFRSEYPNLANDLMDVLGNPKERARFRAFATQHLGELAAATFDPISQQRIVARLSECLSDRHIEVRREALLALCRLRRDEGKFAAIRLMNEAPSGADPGLDTRDLAVRCIRELNLREHISDVRRLATTPVESVRIAALVTLSEWEDKDSIPLFKEAAQSTSIRLRSCGHTALFRMKVEAAKSSVPFIGDCCR